MKHEAQSRLFKLKVLTFRLGVSCQNDADCGFDLIICKDGVCGL